MLPAGAATWFLRPDAKVTARTTLYVEPVQPIILQNVEESRQDGPVYLRNQAYFIKSRFVVREALRRKGIADLNMLRQLRDPEQWLEENIQIEIRGPEFMNIAISGDDKDEIF